MPVSSLPPNTPTSGLANPSSCSLAFHAAIHSHVFVGDELVQSVNPAVVMRQVVIKLGGRLAQFWETRPRDCTEVVMLIVQSNTESQNVAASIVTECLLDRNLIFWVLLLLGYMTEVVVLGNEVRRNRMERTCEQGRQEKIKECVP